MLYKLNKDIIKRAGQKSFLYVIVCGVRISLLNLISYPVSKYLYYKNFATKESTSDFARHIISQPLPFFI